MDITRNDINNDIKMLSDSVADMDRPLVSPRKALKLALFWPGICVLGYTVAVVWMIVTFVPSHNFGMLSISGLVGNFFVAAIGALFALGFGLGFYGPALMYLTIPEDIRNKSIIITRLKRLAKKVWTFFLVCHFALALFSCFYRDAIYGMIPLVFLSFFITQSIISAEIGRYGIAPAMEKMVSLARKV
ncbi:MAG TPA: hypothetical protein VGL07_15650 [Buttiauxella sp.]|jgi:hypothetical protein